jgi:DNA-binding GntR family transcriptional regulator
VTDKSLNPRDFHAVSLFAFATNVLVLVTKDKYAGEMSIASYIKDDLAARLKSGRDLSAQLTLDSLAEYYDVSFTPVRTAVSELIDEGLLEKGPNRRLMAPTPSSKRNGRSHRQKPPKPPRDSFEIISRDLVHLSLKGEPVYLREEATAEKYDISRSAIRNILHRLTGEGMLDHIPRRGWRLRPFRQDDLQAFIEVREVLELKALSLAQPKLIAADLQRMLDANVVTESDDAAPKIDESLHEYFIAAADNVYITDFFERQGRYYRLLFEWEDHDRATAVETVRQHHEVLTALLENNGEAAHRALSHHILDHHPILNQIVENASSDKPKAKQSKLGQNQ